MGRRDYSVQRELIAKSSPLAGRLDSRASPRDSHPQESIMPEFWTAFGPPRSDRPHAIVSEKGERIEDPRLPSDIPIDRAREQPLIRFPAPDNNAAVAIMRTLIEGGVKAFQLYKVPIKSTTWRHRGGPHYLNCQGSRLRIPQVLVDKSRSNDELFAITQLLNQMCERYHKARKEDGIAILNPPEFAQVKATLAEAQKFSSRLHALAAASADMMDEAWKAFGIPQAPAEFAVWFAHDPKPEQPKQEPVAEVIQETTQSSNPVELPAPEVIPDPSTTSGPLPPKQPPHTHQNRPNRRS